MGIKSVEVTDLPPFQAGFSLEFCEGVNVLIGENAVGKTRLTHFLEDFAYNICNDVNDVFEESSTIKVSLEGDSTNKLIGAFEFEGKISNSLYIPETQVVIPNDAGDLIFSLRGNEISIKKPPITILTALELSLSEKISKIINGKIEFNAEEQKFYMVKTDGTYFRLSEEASGYRKLGVLGLLVANGSLQPNTVLFWDEPENNLNPALMSDLADILLGLSRNGVQIFISTHSEILASYFAVNREQEEEVQFTVLYKDGDIIKSNTDSRFDLLRPNALLKEPVKLYEKQLERGFGNVL
ncbi:MAG: AAA family ATPase [Firmicutes bacterium]|nr:AAA family ATPase [Bacillota bacterium]